MILLKRLFKPKPKKEMSHLTERRHALASFIEDMDSSDRQDFIMALADLDPELYESWLLAPYNKDEE